MAQKRPKRRKIIVGFSETDPRDRRLWDLMQADREQETVNVSALVKGLLTQYYEFREATGSIALPPIAEVGGDGSIMRRQGLSDAPMGKPIDLNDQMALEFATSLDFD